MEILSTTITQLNSLITDTGLFSKVYGLCQLERDAQGKATQKIIEYQSSGQGKPITDYDSENGTLAWLMRSPVAISVAPPINKVKSNDEVISITFPLRAIAVVSKEELACDNSTAGDQIAQTLIKALQGQNVAIKTLLSARSFRVEAISYTTNVKEIVKNYEWATLQLDLNVVIITSKDCLPDVCGTSRVSPCAFSVDLINSDGVLVFEITEASDNPFTLPDQPIVDGNGNSVNIPYDPHTPFVTTACSVTCEDATAVLKDTLGATISTTNIPSGDSQDITAPNGTVTVVNSVPTTVDSGIVVSGGSAQFTAPDSSAVLKDTSGTTLSTTAIPSDVSQDITAPDGNVTVNTVAFDSVLSGGSLDVPVQYENGTPVGSIVGGVVEIPNPIVCADATAVLKNTVGTTISSTDIPSGSSQDITAPDATAVLKDTDGNILLTEAIPSNVSEDIVAPDGTVTVNSAAFDTVLSGGSLNIQVRQQTGSTQVGSKQGQYWRIADSDITVNGSTFASVGAEDSLDVKVEYENGTPVGTIVGDTVEIPDIIQDLVTKVNFESGSDLEFTITIDSDTAGTYTANTFGGSITSATYEKNAVAATLPITVVATDTLKIIPDSDDGFVRLTGTY